MTTLEIILSLMLYISFGMWLCFKRNWYKSMELEIDGILFMNALAIVFMPLNFIIIVFRELILREWDN